VDVLNDAGAEIALTRLLFDVVRQKMHHLGVWVLAATRTRVRGGQDGPALLGRWGGHQSFPTKVVKTHKAKPAATKLMRLRTPVLTLNVATRKQMKARTRRMVAMPEF
jgi:hypothetical protein